MLTTLVIATATTTVLGALIVLAMMDFDAQHNFWDPRTHVRAAASLVRSCLQHSQSLVSGAWSQTRRASQALSQSLAGVASVSGRLPGISGRLPGVSGRVSGFSGRKSVAYKRSTARRSRSMAPAETA